MMRPTRPGRFFQGRLQKAHHVRHGKAFELLHDVGAAHSEVRHFFTDGRHAQHARIIAGAESSARHAL
ncbi:MAG: hypothetical protein CMD83_03630, partial [Gammaproteobacteria bacterium]|nr:hypothetical protein [Gammaproteobacteria bacterium]